MDAKNDKELENLIQTIRIYSEGIEMEPGIEKYATLRRVKRKRETTKEKELPNPERIWILGEKGNYKYQGILEAGTDKLTKTKDVRKICLRRTSNLKLTFSAEI